MEIYTAEEKHRIESIRKGFGNYIKKHSYFDILYSEKVGYVFLIVDPEADAQYIPIKSAREFIFFLYEQITNDVLLEKDAAFYGDFVLTEEKREECFCRIGDIVQNMEEEGTNCAELAEEFFAIYPDVWDGEI